MPVTGEEAIFSRWYVTENDVTGDGWAIINLQVDRLSEVYGYGQVRVFAETWTEELARYIVAIHNNRLGVRD
jgi:hypothetical protein